VNVACGREEGIYGQVGKGLGSAEKTSYSLLLILPFSVIGLKTKIDAI
jgi:hypothetical protein